MFAWQKILREGFFPSLPTAGLAALRDALAADDQTVMQGSTTSPPPLQCCADLPVQCCCPVSFALMRGHGLATVGQVEEGFARACFECDQKMGEPAASRWFLNWWDDTPRDDARAELLAEVEAELARRDLTPPPQLPPVRWPFVPDDYPEPAPACEEPSPALLHFGYGV